MLKGMKYRIYPNTEQIEFIERQFSAVRFVWNKSLFLKDHYYKFRKISLDVNKDIKKLLAYAKTTEKYSWLKDFDSIALQQSCINLDKTFKKFFNKQCGKPKFKKKFTYRPSSYHCTGVSVIDGAIKIPKLKQSIKARTHKIPEGKLKSITLTKSPSGKYYASCLFDDMKELPESLKTIKDSHIIGIDLGIKSFYTDSNGSMELNPKFLRQTQKNLAVKQRKMSRKKLGSNNYKKAKNKVAKIHERNYNRRHDFQHKLSAKIVSENQAIIFETLKIKKMTAKTKDKKMKHLSKSILDCGWSYFMTKVKYKLEQQGKHFVKVESSFPSSQLCNCCNSKNPKVKDLKVRYWICPICNAQHDRDVNAAINIKKQGKLHLKHLIII